MNIPTGVKEKIGQMVRIEKRIDIGETRQALVRRDLRKKRSTKKDTAATNL